MNLTDHAKMELKAIGYDIPEDEDRFIKVLSDSEDINDLAVANILELLEVFAGQGHSGFSASYVLGAFSKLANFEALTPLTGEDWEWADISDYSDDPVCQNKRDSRVFKRKDGTSYFINGKVFVEPNGGTYTSRNSLIDVEFPYTPETVYVNVDANGVPIDD